MAAVKILDGGFSAQLSTHVGQKIDGDPLWTARFLTTDMNAVFAAHMDFLRAGADIIETNTYQASISGFIEYLHVTEDEAVGLFHRAVECAKKAVKEYKKETNGKDVPNRNPLIAGSCGPYGAALHDGSEYTGAYGQTVSAVVMTAWHRPRIEALVKSGVDILAFETIPSRQEALALVDLLKEFPETKAWLAFSCRSDGQSVADGTSFRQLALECYGRANAGQLLAIGVNCISPQLVGNLLKDINKGPMGNFVPLVVYTNSGEEYTVEDGWRTPVLGSSRPLEDFVSEWLDLGVRYIGGCCRVYARDVEKIRRAVEKWQRQ